ncbi:MAG: DivIVA domain-containing protein [Oscillospiraceae bacterium]|nr:DivIVA domain-containing protein [Oscillospiraceae bacterium]
MLTSQDIQNKELTRAVFGGYDMSVVDDFLEEVATDFSALQKENAILKSKLKVLVEKVEEYRSTEDAMRMALLTAQRMGDDMITESKQKSEEIIGNAESMAKKQLGELAQEIADEQARLESAKKDTAEFVSFAKKLCEKYNECLDRLDEVSAVPEKPEAEPEKEPSPEDKAASRENEIVDAAKEINKNVSDLLRDDPMPADAPEDEGEPTVIYRTKDTSVNWADDDEPTSPRPKFNFEDLRFGDNYSDKN